MRIDLEQFEKKYMGKVVRDGQCVALMRQYAEECLGIPHTGSVEGAKDLWLHFKEFPLMDKFFTRIMNRNDVRRGDIPIFGPTASNKYGHVAICTESHFDGMECIEQDGFKLNGVKPAFWTWTRFIGALRAKE